MAGAKRCASGEVLRRQGAQHIDAVFGTLADDVGDRLDRIDTARHLTGERQAGLHVAAEVQVKRRPGERSHGWSSGHRRKM